MSTEYNPANGGYTFDNLHAEVKWARRHVTSASKGRVYFETPRFDATSAGYLRLTIDYKVAVDNGDLVNGQYTVAL